jgi:hypothetical protein
MRVSALNSCLRCRIIVDGLRVVLPISFLEYNLFRCFLKELRGGNFFSFFQIQHTHLVSSMRFIVTIPIILLLVEAAPVWSPSWSPRAITLNLISFLESFHPLLEPESLPIPPFAQSLPLLVPNQSFDDSQIPPLQISETMRSEGSQTSSDVHIFRDDSSTSSYDVVDDTETVYPGSDGSTVSSTRSDSSIDSTPNSCMLNRLSNLVVGCRQNAEAKFLELRKIDKATTLRDIHDEYTKGWNGQHSIQYFEQLAASGGPDWRKAGPEKRRRDNRLMDALIVDRMAKAGRDLDLLILNEYEEDDGLRLRLMKIDANTTYKDILNEYTTGFEGQEALKGMKTRRRDVGERIKAAEHVEIMRENGLDIDSKVEEFGRE